MGWSFRRSIKVAPGVRINLSKSGTSMSVGGKGFTYNTRGRTTVSLPGTGIRYTSTSTRHRSAAPVAPPLGLKFRSQYCQLCGTNTPHAYEPMSFLLALILSCFWLVPGLLYICYAVRRENRTAVCVANHARVK
ncbi:DUF4236 domain-containing protein [Paraburkholderia sp. MM5477-R1]|uniref:DUF4236 domain-containing protein n=1 Tax=Paraburkholderia sp. MM5477-R1 TaxID=2991062 RepID=UPI003D1AD8AD